MEAKRLLCTVRSHGLAVSADHLYDLTLLATGDAKLAEGALKERRRQEWERECAAK